LFNPWQTYLGFAQVTWDANFVIAMRLMRLASGGALAQREMRRMVVEKGLSFTEAQLAMAAKMMAGAKMDGIAKSGTNVYRRKVKANRRRLGR
jgi:hypothetical protein